MVRSVRKTWGGRTENVRLAKLFAKLAPDPEIKKEMLTSEDLVPIEPVSDKSSYMRARLRAKLCSLREIVAFQKIPDGLDDVIDRMRSHIVPKGTRIFQQGDQGARMYIIESGSIEILKQQDNDSGEVRVGSYQPGECVGHLSLLDSLPRAASAIATKNCTLWSLDRETLREFMSRGFEQDSEEPESCILPREVFVISDSTGESAVSAVRKTILQFQHCDAWDMCNIMTYRFVKTTKELQHIVGQAQRTDAIIVFTIVDPHIKKLLEEEAAKQNVELVDLYGPLIKSFEKSFGSKISGTPGRKQPVNEDYMELMDCIEYTRKMDDGANPAEWAEADLIVIGPSRAGKTPLSFYLSLRGFKVANYPIVPEETPPTELLEYPDKVVALTIDPERLAYIREQRMKQFGRETSRYANIDEIRAEINYIERFYRQNPGWFVVDTTNSGVEETAAVIYEYLDRKSGGALKPHQTRGII